MIDTPVILAAALTGGSLGIIHFALHPEVTGYKLPRPIAYTIGVGVIATVTTWLGLTVAQTPADVLRILWASIVAGAAATLGGRWFRWQVDAWHARRERDELVRKARGE